MDNLYLLLLIFVAFILYLDYANNGYQLDKLEMTENERTGKKKCIFLFCF